MKKVLIILLGLFLFVTIAYASSLATATLDGVVPETATAVMLLLGCGLLGLAGVGRKRSNKK